MASQLSGGIIYIGGKPIEDTISRISHGILIVIPGGQEVLLWYYQIKSGRKFRNFPLLPGSDCRDTSLIG